jgi:adenosylcobinamide-phosphate synthase
MTTWQDSAGPYALLVAAAFFLDLAVGDPHSLSHPVVLMGKFIAAMEKKFRRGRPRWDFMAGAIISLALIGISVGAAWGLIALASLLSSLLSSFLVVGLASTTLATRGLLDAGAKIENCLREKNLAGARNELAHIVGRETHSLNEDKVLRASLESLAENASDGVVAPLFYLSFGGLPLAMAYKAVNTLDSMIGYRTERYLYFGKFAARLDDLVNFIPARLTALFMVIGAYATGRNGSRAFKVLWQDHAKHLSPNAGYPEAAMAGALGVRLGGPSVYFGNEIAKPYIGEDTAQSGARTSLLKEARYLCLATALISLATFFAVLVWIDRR